MARSIRGITKKQRGRPRTTGKGEPVMVRLHDDLLKPLDRWISEQPASKPSRPDAVRVALKDWLMGLGLLDLGSTGSGAADSAKIAGQTIDRIQDPAATLDERTQRKRRLIKGPKEFRGMRSDQPKPKG
jgi:hypothetical protein